MISLYFCIKHSLVADVLMCENVSTLTIKKICYFNSYNPLSPTQVSSGELSVLEMCSEEFLVFCAEQDWRIWSWATQLCWIRWPGADYLQWAVDSGSDVSLSLSPSICHESLSHPARHPDRLMICPRPLRLYCFLVHLSSYERWRCLVSQSLLSGQDTLGSGTHLEDVSPDFSPSLCFIISSSTRTADSTQTER